VVTVAFSGRAPATDTSASGLAKDDRDTIPPSSDVEDIEVPEYSRVCDDVKPSMGLLVGLWGCVSECSMGTGCALVTTGLIKNSSSVYSIRAFLLIKLNHLCAS